MIGTGKRLGCRVAWASRRGANAVEFAMLSVVLIPMLCACAEYGWVMYYQASLSAALAQGARTGAVTLGGSATPVPQQTAAEAEATSYWQALGFSSSTVTFVASASQPLAGVDLYLLHLDGQSDYSGLFGGIVPVPDSISSRVSVRIERE